MAIPQQVRDDNAIRDVTGSFTLRVQDDVFKDDRSRMTQLQAFSLTFSSYRLLPTSDFTKFDPLCFHS